MNFEITDWGKFWIAVTTISVVTTVARTIVVNSSIKRVTEQKINEIKSNRVYAEWVDQIVREGWDIPTLSLLD